MSMRPSASFIPSSGCSRSATQAPPVCRPIIAVCGVTRAFSSAASFGTSASASGSRPVMEVLLQDQLRGLRVERLAARELDRLAHADGYARAALDFRRAVALVDHPHGQAEAAVQLAREALGAARHLVRRAVLAERPADDEQRRLPFLHEPLDGGEAARLAQRR